MGVELLHPEALILLGIAVPWILIAEGRADGSSRRRAARAAVRVAIAGLLVLALAQPEKVDSHARARRIVVAVDRSAAMHASARAEAAEALARARVEARTARVPLEVLGFTTHAASCVPCPPAPPNAADGWPSAPPGAKGDGVPEPPAAPEARPAAGVAGALAAYRAGEDGTVLLLTTGRGDLEGLEDAAAAAEAQGIRIRARAVPEEAPPSQVTGPRVKTFDLPAVAGGPFDVRALVSGEGPLEVLLLVNGEARQEQSVPAGEDPRSVSFRSLSLEPGRSYEIALRVQGAEAPGEATLERRLVRVESPPRVVLAIEAAETSRVRRALSAQGFVVEAVPPDALAARIATRRAGVDALVLDATAAVALPPDAQDLLSMQIEEGLGLLLVAGASEEAWTRLASARLARVLPLRAKAPLPPPEEPTPPPPPKETRPDIEPPEPDPGPGLRAERRPEEAVPISLVIVLDRSGSMEGPKLSMAIEAARRAAASLSRYDRVGVITFAEDSTLDIPPSPATRLGNLGWRLASVVADGNTDIYGALVRAREVLEREDAPIRHLILLTDGKQTARFAVFGHLVEGMARAGITVTTVGLGPNHSEALLKNIAMLAPRGRYVPADTAAQLPTILTRDTQRVDEYRKREAAALARIEDKDGRQGEPADPPEAPTEPSVPTTDPPTESSPPTPPERPADAVALLAIVRPHEATSGLDQEPMPQVGHGRRAAVRRGSALLLIRGEDEPALAASRFGLGRVLQWALPPDAPGLASWPALPRLYVQAIRSVRAPRGAFSTGPMASVLPGPDGERLRLEAAPGAPAPALRVTWEGPGGRRELGVHRPGLGDDLALPAAAAGETATVHLAEVPEEATDPEGPVSSLTYLARGRRPVRPAAGDPAALAARLGPEAVVEPGEPLLAPAGRDPEGRPLWPLALILALALLPLDAGLHRRAVRGAP